MRTVAIMQPCYLPWRGYFALMRHADVFVHLDDVDLPRGRSPQTRAAVRTPHGRRWLTLPVRRGSTRRIDRVELADDRFRRVHRATLAQHLPSAATHVDDLLDRTWTSAADLSIAAAERLAETLWIDVPTLRATELGADGRGSEHLLRICRHLNATRYVTGHGAAAYLDHPSFERHGIDVLYMDYDLAPYPQPHGAFDPTLSVLDALQHAPDPPAHVGGGLVPWRQFLARRQRPESIAS